MEKDYKEIVDHLYLFGYKDEAIDKICGWMIGSGLKSAEEKILYKKGNRTFEDFLNWYNSKDEKTLEVLKGDFIHIDDKLDVLALTELEGNRFVGTNGVTLQCYELKKDSRFCFDSEIQPIEARLKKNGIYYCMDCNDLEVITEDFNNNKKVEFNECNKKCNEVVDMIAKNLKDDNANSYERDVTSAAIDLLIQLVSKYE